MVLLRYSMINMALRITTLSRALTKACVQLYNQYIRRVIHFFETKSALEDLWLIVKKQLYLPMAESDRVEFLANGDYGEVDGKLEIWEIVMGFRFANTLELRLQTIPDEPNFEAKVRVFWIPFYVPSPSGDQESIQTIYFGRFREIMNDVASKVERKGADNIKDPFLNAVRSNLLHWHCHKPGWSVGSCFLWIQGYLPERSSRPLILHEWLLYCNYSWLQKICICVNFDQDLFL